MDCIALSAHTLPGGCRRDWLLLNPIRKLATQIFEKDVPQGKMSNEALRDLT